MARVRASITTEGEIALGAGVAKTIMQIAAPANQRCAVTGFSVSFDGTSGAAEPVQVTLMKQTSAGTMTAATENRETGAETVQTVGQVNATIEPTSGAVLRRYNVHPQTGYERVFGRDEEIEVAGGERLGVVCTSPASVNVTGHLCWEE